MTEASSPLSTRVPVHSLGISQILSYGLMFYAFAALKTPVAAATSLGESTVLTVLSMALILQAILMPIVGSWCDRYGALSVMRIGFLTGAAGIVGLGFAGVVPVPTMIWLAGCFLLVGTGLAMSTYEVAFSAAVQLHEAKSRRSISIITFYGGVASSLTWLSIHPLLEAAGLTGTCLVISGALVFASLMIGNAARRALPLSGMRRPRHSAGHCCNHPKNERCCFWRAQAHWNICCSRPRRCYGSTGSMRNSAVLRWR